MTTHFTGEVQLMGYGESDSSGAWIKLQVTPEDLEAFRGLKGTTFDILLANPDQPIGAPQEPTPSRPKGGTLAKEAGKICHVLEFQQYCADQLTSVSSTTFEPTHDIAASYIRSFCGIGSRAELDHNETAAKKFRNLMTDYSRWFQTCESL